MSDLYIESRLQAIKDIASVSSADIKDADNIASFCDEIYSAIPKIDKIVEELELHSFELGTDTLPAHYVRLNEAIEIVKQGGVSDDTNDVCEWIKYDYRTICPKNHDANTPYWRIPDNTDKLKYCPYCSKKIKVVEQMDEEDYCYCHYHDDTYEYFDCLDYMECEECPYYYADEDQVVEQ